MKAKALMPYAIAFCIALPLFAADWTDANNNQYTALKYIKGNGSGSTGGPRIITDIQPTGTDTVKLRFKPTTVSGNDCLYCTRKSGSNAVYAFSGFRTSGRIRIDRHDTRRYMTCTNLTLAANTEYAVVADYNKGNVVSSLEDSAVSVNGEYMLLHNSNRPDGKLGTTSYTPAGPLMLFASHTAGSELSESSDYDNSGSYYLYYFQLYASDGTLTHNLMPAQNASGVAGLYDTVGRKFYGPVGPSGYDTFDSEPKTEVTGTDVKKWTGLGGDNKMSSGANWEGGVAPAAGQDLDFTIAVPLVGIDADIPGVTFGKLWLGDSDIPAFTGSMTVSAVNFPLKVAGNPAITIVAGDYTWNGGAAANWGDAAAWLYEGVAMAWADNNNAIFNADTTATLDRDVSAMGVVFNADVSIVTNSEAHALAATTVSVASGKTATIDAPTSGALEKTGKGTLALSQSRTEPTTITEGSLAFSGTAALDWSNFTFGTDPAKSVTLDFGPAATLATVPDTWQVGIVDGVTNTIVKRGGDWAVDTTFSLGRAPGAVSTFINESGDLLSANNFHIGGGEALLSVMTVGGGTVGSTSPASIRVFVGYFSEGILTVTNTGVFTSQKSLFVGNRANGTVNVSDGGQVLVGDDIVFSYKLPTCGVINLGRGVIEANRAYMMESGSATLNFDGGAFRRANANGDLFAANGDAKAIDVTVSANGGTIDNNGLSVALPRTVVGAGGLTLAGSGTTTISADQAYLGTTTVSNGTTLAVTGVAFAGPLVLEAGSSLEITNYAAVVPAVSAPALTLPSAGSIPLTFNGGAFPQGVYAICSAEGVTAADGAKFSFATDGGLASAWSLVGSTLVLTVGSVSGNYWTGLAGDGKMSSAANWASGSAPRNGADIDFSAISRAATISADIPNATFGTVTMGEGVITFTNSLAATGFSDTSKIAVGENSTVTIEGDLVYTGSITEHICHTVAEGGRFVVTGDIVAAAGKRGYLYPSVTTSIEGVIAAKGLVNNASGRSLLLAPSGGSINWEIGENGISGSYRCYISSGANAKATVVAAANFAISGVIEDGTVLELDTTSPGGTPCTVTVGKGSSGYIYSSGCVRVSGTGRVLFNSGDSTFSGGLDVLDTATLAVKPGAGVGHGAVTVGNGATLEVAASGTATIGGDLALADGASLAFNFTDREMVPALALADGNTLSFAGEGATNITVKCSSAGGIWPRGGMKTLTVCGGFAAEGVSVSLAAPAPAWVRGLSVDGDGNIVLDVIHKGLLISIK